MHSVLTRAAVGVALLVTLGAASGCVAEPGPVVTVLPSDASGVTPTATATPSSTPTRMAPSPIESRTPDTGVGDETDCGGGALVVAASDEDMTIVGTCTTVEIQGNDLTVDASSAQVDALRVSGDRIDITIDGVEQVTIDGNDDAVVSTGAIDELTIRGDRNGLRADGVVESVEVSGNDNLVQAERVESVVVQGQGNAVG